MRGRSRHRGTWTERQRQVLDLLARRYSNAQIADELGITVDGVKWHIREILSTLNVQTREDAAEYWRKERGLPARLRRAGLPLAGGAALKWGAGALAVGAIAAVSLLAGVALRDDPTDSEPVAAQPAGDSGTSFYLEAWMEQANTALDEPHDTFAPNRSELRWWASGPRLWRKESSSYHWDGAFTETILLADGTFVWGYTPGQAEYGKSDAHSWGDYGSGPNLAMLVGPSPASNLTDLVARLDAYEDLPRRVAVAGNDMILGRSVVVIEYEPLVHTLLADGSTGGGAGVGRMWVDTETLFVLKHVGEVEGWGELFHVEVTTIRYGEQAAADTFVFVPPPGTTEAPPFTGFQRPEPPEWLLAPSYVPDGYEGSGFSMSGARDWVEMTWHVDPRDLSTRSSRYIVVEQREGGAPLVETRPGGRHVQLPGRDVYVVEQGGIIYAGFRESDIAVVVWSDSLGIDEVLAVAVSIGPSGPIARLGQ
jgi:DNA-binding CsgD family transcriptional regulator/outer membrane lipoprotein-sorting protein